MINRLYNNSDISGKPSANASVKNSQKSKMMITTPTQQQGYERELSSEKPNLF